MWSRKIAVALSKPIPNELVGDDGKGNDAIPWYITVQELNRIFGPWAWSHSVISCEVRDVHTRQSRAGKENTVVTVSAIVELTVSDSGHTVTHRSVGVDTNFGPADQAYRVAEMGAEHIALKRCATKLGPALGLHLYDGGGHGRKIRYPFNNPPVWADEMSATTTPAPVAALPEPAPMPAAEESPQSIPEPPAPQTQWQPTGTPPAAAPLGEQPDKWKSANRMLHGALGELASDKSWDPEYKSKVCDLLHFAVCQNQDVSSITEVDPDHLEKWAAGFSGMVKRKEHSAIMGKLKVWAEERKQQ